MATNFKSDGKHFDANLIIQTGTTITGGSMVFCDVSGTNVVRAIRSYSGATVESASPATGVGQASLDVQPVAGRFLGVLANTQTGTPNLSGGHQTGVTFFTEGVFEFNSTPTASAALRIGAHVFAVTHDTVRAGTSGVDAELTASNCTGTVPIGVVSFLPRGPIISNTVASRVRVKIFPFRTLPVVA